MKRLYPLIFLALLIVGTQAHAQALQAGDIVFTAYRSSATGADDEIQFLALVDIAGSTEIMFTDAKYNDNGQCPDGLTWTAPAEGVPALSVVNILVDKNVSSTKGTVIGSSFGLSSGGDQVIVYTGANTSPNYITALTTNAWTTSSLTICNNSLSKIPAGLVDGQTSLNMSTATGNVSGNSANGFYNGTHTGTPAQLRAAILNPANWTIAIKDASPQTWPAWSEPEPIVLHGGDIVFTAYRSSANGAADEIQFLTLVDIAGSTEITFTDSKYNDNGQCPNGLVWTAPASGLPAMSVVNIVVDGTATTTTGTISGSSFGLSSGGDQVIVYTGASTSPNYITALTTNAWTTASLTVCNNSFSKIPAGLIDGQTSLNMSTATGNVSGNSANGFYNGTHTGTASQLRAAVLNPANWTIAIKDTSPQIWPAWSTSNPTPGGISFDKKFASVAENAGKVSIKLKLQDPITSTVKLVLKAAPYSTASSDDFTYATKTLEFNGSSTADQIIDINITDDGVKEQDEYFVLTLEDAQDVTIGAVARMTVFIKDNDRVAPVGTKSIELKHVASFEPVAGDGTAEIVVHDPVKQRLFIISSIERRLDIANFSDPTNISLFKSIDMTEYGGITSVAVRKSIVAVASPNVTDDQANGQVVFFDTDGNFISKVTVGVLPDMITFTPDGSKVLTANEGQPNSDYSHDAEGSVSVIDISGGIPTLDQSKVTTMLFTEYNSQETALKNAGVRKLFAASTMSQDFEPEYIAISPDSKKAWVTLQENNAMAEINLETKTYTSIWALGKKDHSIAGNGLDGSHNNGVVEISNWPVKSFYIPDGVAGFKIDNTQYLITANEGDEKEYTGFEERTTVGAVALDPTVFPHAAFLKEDHNIGQLRMTSLSGDTDSDGDYDEINIVGGRSFTIWNADTKQKVYDSGDEFERITSTDPTFGSIFNADNENNTFKSRSRAKGPEPEGVTVAQLADKTYAFIGLERIGGVMVYDISNPAMPVFVDYKNSRSTTALGGDLGPEGIIYISREQSPNGKAYVAVANELSGTVSVYEVLNAPKMSQAVTFDDVTTKTVGDEPFDLTATASTGKTVTFTADGEEITISGKRATIVKAGKVTVTATQAGDDIFAISEASRVFCVRPAQPVISLTAGDNSSVITLSSSEATDNVWFKDDTNTGGATGQTLQVTEPGVYTVMSVVETCTSDVSENFPVVVTGDIKELNQQLSISPNPSDDKVMIQLPGTGLKHIRILNSNGVEVATAQSHRDAESINIADLSKGFYIVHVKSSTGIHYGKFIRK